MLEMVNVRSVRLCVLAVRCVRLGVLDVRCLKSCSFPLLILIRVE